MLVQSPDIMRALVTIGKNIYAWCMRTYSVKHVAHGRVLRTDGVLMDEPDLPGPMDLAAIFGNKRPVEVEIGTGKGTFLLGRAARRAELNFLGIEWARAYCLYTADRLRRAGLRNVRMLRADAGEFFRCNLADASVWCVHVYFPDPWPKRRHHRRRLIRPGFIDDVCRVLRPGGQIVIVTDHLDYFRHIQAVLKGPQGLAAVPFPKMTTDDDELVGTNFERKYIAQGRPFFWTARMKYAGK